jgi:hypothetical protein
MQRRSPSLERNTDMENPLITERRSALDLSAVQGLSANERAVATARMEQAMMLGELTLRAARRARAMLRAVGNALFGGPATQKRGA